MIPSLSLGGAQSSATMYRLKVCACVGGVEGVGSAGVCVGPRSRGSVEEEVLLGVGGGWYSSSSSSESSLRSIMATLLVGWVLQGWTSTLSELIHMYVSIRMYVHFERSKVHTVYLSSIQGTNKMGNKFLHCKFFQ